MFYVFTFFYLSQYVMFDNHTIVEDTRKSSLFCRVAKEEMERELDNPLVLDINPKSSLGGKSLES
jgi:hypothetical protein